MGGRGEGAAKIITEIKKKETNQRYVAIEKTEQI